MNISKNTLAAVALCITGLALTGCGRKPTPQEEYNYNNPPDILVELKQNNPVQYEKVKKFVETATKMNKAAGFVQKVHTSYIKAAAECEGKLSYGYDSRGTTMSCEM